MPWLLKLIFPASLPVGMDLGFYQRLSAISVAFSAGLLSRHSGPAPHIHVTACPDAPDCEAACGWSSSFVVLVGLGCFALGRCWVLLGPYLRLARRVIVRALLRRARSPAPRPVAALARAPPPALFAD